MLQSAQSPVLTTASAACILGIFFWLTICFHMLQSAQATTASAARIFGVFLLAYHSFFTCCSQHRRPQHQQLAFCQAAPQTPPCHNPMAQQPWMKMMTWVCRDHRLPARHLLDRAGQAHGPQQPLSQLAGGKLPWVKPLGGLGEAHNRWVFPQGFRQLHQCCKTNKVQASQRT